MEIQVVALEVAQHVTKAIDHAQPGHMMAVIKGGYVTSIVHAPIHLNGEKRTSGIYKAPV